MLISDTIGSLPTLSSSTLVICVSCWWTSLNISLLIYGRTRFIHERILFASNQFHSLNQMFIYLFWWFSQFPHKKLIWEEMFSYLENLVGKVEIRRANNRFFVLLRPKRNSHRVNIWFVNNFIWSRVGIHEFSISIRNLMTSTFEFNYLSNVKCLTKDNVDSKNYSFQSLLKFLFTQISISIWFPT